MWASACELCAPPRMSIAKSSSWTMDPYDIVVRWNYGWGGRISMGLHIFRSLLFYFRREIKIMVIRAPIIRPKMIKVVIKIVD